MTPLYVVHACANPPQLSQRLHETGSYIHTCMPYYCSIAGVPFYACDLPPANQGICTEYWYCPDPDIGSADI